MQRTLGGAEPTGTLLTTPSPSLFGPPPPINAEPHTPPDMINIPQLGHPHPDAGVTALITRAFAKILAQHGTNNCTMRELTAEVGWGAGQLQDIAIQMTLPQYLSATLVRTLQYDNASGRITATEKLNTPSPTTAGTIWAGPATP